MRISDWSSDVCSSDLEAACGVFTKCVELRHARDQYGVVRAANLDVIGSAAWAFAEFVEVEPDHAVECAARMNDAVVNAQILRAATVAVRDCSEPPLQIGFRGFVAGMRSEEHTSELQSLMRISYAVFCLKKKNIKY